MSMKIEYMVLKKLRNYTIRTPLLPNSDIYQHDAAIVMRHVSAFSVTFNYVAHLILLLRNG